MNAYQSIDISAITIPAGRLRDVDQDWAIALSGMFEEVGHKTPIDVVADGKGFSLIAGAHRLTAAARLKWKKIDARILEPEADQPAEHLRLHEILENLGRKDFNALERSEALCEMKRIYEVLHPQTKHGGKRGNQHTGGEKRQDEIFSFCQNAAETTGLTPRSVQIAVAIFIGLSPATRERLKGTPQAEKQSDLKALSALTNDEQSKVLDLLLAEDAQASSIADALVLVQGKKPKSETDKVFRAAQGSLNKLPKGKRLILFEAYEIEIIALGKKKGWFNA